MCLLLAKKVILKGSHSPSSYDSTSWKGGGLVIVVNG